MREGLLLHYDKIIPLFAPQQHIVNGLFSSTYDYHPR